MKTLIAMIIDQSGSMYVLTESTKESFKAFIEDQKKVEGEAIFLLTLFNYEVNVGSLINLKDVNDLIYEAAGGTRLNDGIGQTIDHVGKLFESKEVDAEKVIVCIITDGQENSSRNYSTEKIKEMVQHQQEKYNWQFIFFGANIDAFNEGSNLRGIQNSVNYENTKEGLTSAYSSLSSQVRAAR